MSASDTAGPEAAAGQCTPPAGTASDTWHWLRHSLIGSLIVSEWHADTWRTGQGWWDTAPLGSPGASSADVHKWGWRWVAEAVPPLEKAA